VLNEAKKIANLSNARNMGEEKSDFFWQLIQVFNHVNFFNLLEEFY